MEIYYRDITIEYFRHLMLGWLNVKVTVTKITVGIEYSLAGLQVRILADGISRR